MIFKRLYCLLVLSTTSSLAVAQTSVAPVNADRSIEQSIHQLQNQAGRIKPLANLDVLGLENAKSIDKLLAVEADNDALQKGMQGYWASRLGKSVAAEDVQAFNGWLFDQARSEGYLSYAVTHIEKRDGGSVLKVQIVRPHIHAVRVNSLSPELQQKYAEIVAQRLRKILLIGHPLDTLALDQRLDTACFDLPIELDSTVRAAGRDEVDLIINITPAPQRKGEVRDVLLQLNNYGLKSYGRPQILGSVTIGGLQPRSTLNLVGQVSEGIAYGRAEYDFADPASQGHWHLWGSASDTHSILGGATASNGKTAEVGVGHRSQITEGYRGHRFQESADFVARKSQTYLSSTGSLTSEVHDYQGRFRESIDNSKLSSDASHADFTVTIGGYGRLVNQDNIDTMYAKVDMDLRQQHTWDMARKWYTVVHVKGQLNSGRLDSYNQLALGGVDAVRAYTSVDGVGDRGILMNLELNRRLDNGMTVGAFYDVGSVRLLSANTSSEYGGRYTLQALGMQWSVNDQHWFMNASVAKGLGGYKAWTAYNIESIPNNWRVYGSLTYRF